MNLFDAVAAAIVRTTDTVFGYDATWTPISGAPINGRVKYKDMTGEAKLGEHKYGVDNWKIEFTDSDFPGLKDFISSNGKAAITVNVRGTNIAFIGITA